MGDNTRLGKELAKLSAENPEVAAAEKRLDDVTDQIRREARMYALSKAEIDALAEWAGAKTTGFGSQFDAALHVARSVSEHRDRVSAAGNGCVHCGQPTFGRYCGRCHKVQ